MRTRLFLTLIGVIAACAFAVNAQTTEFVYQGQLQNSAAPASGSFDFEFLLFDQLAAGGNQQGSTLTRSGVLVTNGIFSVKLDFGSQFPGADRFLEIHVRQAGVGSFVPLTPRQAVSNTPYAVKSLNADTATTATNATNATNASQLGGVAANQYTLTTDSRLTDARAPTAGSTNYVQNGTVQQASSNFNVSGNGVIGARFSVGGAVASGDTMSVTSISGNPVAIHGYSGTGSAVFGTITGGSTSLPAVQGVYSGTGTGAGVAGLSNAANGTGIVAGGNGGATQVLNAGSGLAATGTGVGIFGFATTIAGGTGVLAVGNGGTSQTLVAGSGLAANGFDTGVYATVTSNGPAQALLTSSLSGFVRVNYWNGATQFKINGAGAVSTIIRDAEEKQRIMFAPEAPEVLFEDYGTGKLTDGKAVIVLDPTLAANLSVNERHPLKVFIQLEGDCKGVFVTNKTSSGFEVIELQGGKSNVGFSWHVIGNRADEQLESVGPDGKITRRISHYADLRLPVQQEDQKISQLPVTSPK